MNPIRRSEPGPKGGGSFACPPHLAHPDRRFVAGRSTLRPSLHTVRLS